MRKKTFKRSPNIGKILDVSTGHVTLMDTRLLDNQKDRDNPVVTYKYDRGYFIPVINPKDIDGGMDLESYGYSEAFAALYRRCILRRYDYIRLDGDGEVYSDLKLFNW